MTTTTRPYQACGECGTTYVTVVELLAAHTVKGLPLTACDLSTCPVCELPFLYRPVPGIAGELPGHAAVLADSLRRNGFNPERAVERNLIKLQEEAGEVAGAYLRSTGQARRTGTTQALHEEVADVILTAFSLAHHLDMDINAALAAKLRTIHTRGYRDNPAGGEAA
jgi:NTP pyrophosphatase (non-canonical NTP hydrolase)